MPPPGITEAEATRIVDRRKFIHRINYDNTRPSLELRRKNNQVEPDEKRIVYEVRFADMRGKDAGLQMMARLEKAISGVHPRPMPGLSLRWHGIRIRGVNHALRHECMLNGVNSGFVKGWHEKVWTKLDTDKNIVDINNLIGNTDLSSMIRFCCERWNIEVEDKQLYLGEI